MHGQFGEIARPAADAQDGSSKVDALGCEVVAECRATLMASFRYLSTALWHMPLAVEEGLGPLGTDGESLCFGSMGAVLRYRANPSEMTRDLLHLVLHCVFRHPFDGDHDNARALSLACDIMVESIAMDMCGQRFASELDTARAAALEQLEERVGSLASTKLYRAFDDALGAADDAQASAPYDPFADMRADVGGDGASALTLDDIAELEELFARDDHARWVCNAEDKPARPDNEDDDAESASSDSEDFRQEPSEREDGSEGEGDDESQDDQSLDGGEGDEPDDEAQGVQSQDEGEGGQGQEPDQDDNDADSGGDTSSDEVQLNGAGTGSGDAEGQQHEDESSSAPEPQQDDREQSQKNWEDIAKQMEMELAAHCQMWGEEAGMMSAALSVANRKTCDYTDFLRRFCTLAEDMQINDDEFDYIFYTYGIERYGNIPLVEPLEYMETNRVREFAIAIDTSGSCSGELVRTFIERTYDVMRESASFGSTINVHIIQCDAKIQQDIKVTSIRELDEYMDNFELRGFGGTDFRPVFEYVDKLLEDGEFDNLQGLIYFTDGMGTFPKREPDYDTAFVFVNDTMASPHVPPWAMKVLMDEEDVFDI